MIGPGDARLPERKGLMSRALLAIALALSLGNPAAVLSWTEGLFQLALPMAGESGGPGDPNGGTLPEEANSTGDTSDAGNQWDPDG